MGVGITATLKPVLAQYWGNSSPLPTIIPMPPGQGVAGLALVITADFEEQILVGLVSPAKELFGNFSSCWKFPKLFC